jgi:hypothetical protein
MTGRLINFHCSIDVDKRRNHTRHLVPYKTKAGSAHTAISVPLNSPDLY